jgi:cytochrome c oxidase cbb3-type subunit 2
MNIAPFVFIGLLATFAMSWFGFVFRPHAELSRQPAFVDPITSAVYPVGRSGQGVQGAEVYRAQGCAACHTQQVRPAQEGNDIQRGFGTRRTVGTDFMLDNPPQLGAIRLGPDLANYGLRKTTNDLNEIYLHLLDPKAVVAKSNMPKYPYLFDKLPSNPNRIGALRIPSDKDHDYVPKDEAKQLAAYLLSLRNEGSVFEAPRKLTAADTNAPTGDTNAPAAAATNTAPTK